MKKCCQFICIALLVSNAVFAQSKVDSISLINNKALEPVNVKAGEETYKGVKSVKVEDIGKETEAKFLKINGYEFTDGVVEVDVVGKPGGKATEGARGFVGIAFRINNDNSKFECIYLRPTNGRADDQVRRNHSVQYVSFPDFPWYVLREKFPEKYESYVDLVPGEWTKVRIEVKGDKAKLYVHGNPQPVLLVNDLKHGAENRGNIGLWIGPETEAHFSNLRVTKSGK